MLKFKFRRENFFRPQTTHGRPVVENPYVAACRTNDFSKFVSLVESKSQTRNWSRDGLLMYYVILCHRRLEMFNYLINLDNFDIDSVDSFGRTLLMNIALRTESFIDQFASALIRKGANFHLADNQGNTYLHMAAANSEHLANAQLVIEKGADVNAQNDKGVTPLNIACKSGNVDMIHMLLYYGANATISTNEGLLPIAMYCISTEHNDEEAAFLLEILFNHTFDDDDDITLPVINLVASMSHNEFYSKISNVTYYETYDLGVVCKLIHDCAPETVEFLFEKFGNVMKDTINNFRLLDMVMEFETHRHRPKLWGVLKILLESKYGATLVQDVNPYSNIIFEIVKQSNSSNDTYVEEMEMTKMICLMLSYGLLVTSLDLDIVYYHYGYCELFRILLHMDMTMVSSTWGAVRKSVTPLYCNPGMNFDELLATCPPVFLSKYYHHPKLTNILMRNDYKGVVARTEMSQVPLLVELSRNVARKYIAKKYNVNSSKQFYTILNWLPIGGLNRSILSLEKPLYEGVVQRLRPTIGYILFNW